MGHVATLKVISVFFEERPYFEGGFQINTPVNGAAAAHGCNSLGLELAIGVLFLTTVEKIAREKNLFVP